MQKERNKQKYLFTRFVGTLLIKVNSLKEPMYVNKIIQSLPSNHSKDLKYGNNLAGNDIQAIALKMV